MSKNNSKSGNTNTSDTEMPFLSHLVELRDRLLRSVIVIAIFFVGLAIFSKQLYQLLTIPLMESLPEGATQLATQVVSPLLAPFKLAFVAALCLSMPYLLHQAWQFISPGLYKKEKKFAVPLLVSSVILFYIGISFAYFVILPLMFSFMSSIGIEGVSYAPDINSVLDISLKIFFAFGLAFEVPIATLLIIWSGISSVEKLKEKRPYIIIGAFFFGMLLTPPDIFSQTLLAIPMWLLFELGLIFAKMYSPSNASEETGSETNETNSKKPKATP